MMRRSVLLGAVALASAAAAAPASKPLFDGKTLDGWESIGDGIWTVLPGGLLVGQRDVINNGPRAKWIPTQKEYMEWLNRQAWLYTTRNDFAEFDLHVEFWARHGGNSGISIRDTSRAQYAVTTPPDFRRTPAKIGYEIQINNGYPDPTPTGSIYTFAKAKTGVQIDDQWNSLDVESRSDMIRVKLNGQVVAEHAGDPARSKTGPIGLQLHDYNSVMMFRNIRMREISAAGAKKPPK